MDAFIKAIEMHRDECYEEKHKIEMESHEKEEKIRNLNAMEGMD